MNNSGTPDASYKDGPSTDDSSSGRLQHPHGRHGFGGQTGDPPEPAVGPPGMYTGSPLFREGGVRAGGVSEPETLPAMYSIPKSRGFDEHDNPRTTRPVHGVPGVEGIPRENGGDAEPWWKESVEAVRGGR